MVVVTHLFNDGTYHRGQLINMFRRLGIEASLKQILSFGVGRNKRYIMFIFFSIMAPPFRAG